MFASIPEVSLASFSQDTDYKWLVSADTHKLKFLVKFQDENLFSTPPLAAAGMIASEYCWWSSI